MADNGNGLVTLTREQFNMLTVNALIADRSKLAGGLGITFEGKRDIYKALGYKKAPGFSDYWDKFKRQDVAGRIISKPCEDTWRKPPPVKEGLGDDAKDDTDFVRKWKELAGRLRVWHHLQRVDTLASIGRYAVLLIGVRDGTEAALGQDIGKVAASGDVIYLKPYSDGAIEKVETGTDPSNERYGLPELYRLKTAKNKTIPIHWSRCIHVVENNLIDDVYGTPRLEAVYNRLDDLEKAMGGAAEAVWRVMNRGMAFKLQDGHALKPEDEAALTDEIEAYMHQLKNFMQLTGVEVESLGSESVDPKPVIEPLMDLICGAVGIPQRILMGSERGDLASTQDAANWAGVIDSRQQDYAEPVILRPFIDRLIAIGALPAPESGVYSVGELGPDGMYHWPGLFDLTDQEKANVRKARAETYEALIRANVDPYVAAKRAGYSEAEADEMRPAADGTTPQANSKDILGHHIETGVVTKNEARADVGLPPVDDAEDQRQRQLISRLAVLQAARNAGVPLEAALRLAGLAAEVGEIEPGQEGPDEIVEGGVANKRPFVVWPSRQPESLTS